jgi:hypothetical protein
MLGAYPAIPATQRSLRRQSFDRWRELAELARFPSLRVASRRYGISQKVVRQPKRQSFVCQAKLCQMASEIPEPTVDMRRYAQTEVVNSQEP